MKRRYFERNDWRQRVNTAFTEYWSAKKRLDGVDPRDEITRKKAWDEFKRTSRLRYAERLKLQDSRYAKVWQEIIRPLDGEVWPGSGEPGKGYAVNPEATGFFRDLVFLMFGMTYRQIVTLAENDASAHRKLIRVHQQYYHFRWSGGGFKNLRLKFNMNHFQVIVDGLDCGLNSLNPLELESCFNEICPCAQRHSAEYLKRLLRNVKRACDRLNESMNDPTWFEMRG